MWLKRKQEILDKMKKLEESHEPIELSFREFVEICLAQYAVLIPIALGVTFIFFLVLVFIVKIWYRG